MEESKRQKKWTELGYTKEQIEIHLSWERRKTKESRERKKRNNEENKELIRQIKEDLLNKTFYKDTITRISPSVDGLGFWWKTHKIFSDGSEGDFRYFCYYNDYTKEEFIENLKTI